MMDFNSVLAKYRKIAFSERDKGDRFERLMQAYLRTDPKYAQRFREVWLWSEFPFRQDFGGGDTGIDLVARTVDGDYWAIQCKCYAETDTIDKPAVDTFLSTSGRAFRDENLQQIRFVQRLWISTTNKWGSNAVEAIKNQNPPVTRLSLYDLQEAPVDWEKLEQGIHGEASRTAKKTLRQHQIDALEQTHAHFATAERGKLIMACGTGKTFTALRIAENETGGTGTILFLVPSIALLGQTLREWTADAAEDINAICICSDPKVSKSRAKDEDTDLTSVVDLALPASTDVPTILGQFRAIEANPAAHKGMTVVFSTYQSIEVVAEAQESLRKEGGRFGEFDLIVCDEAHRTTGVTLAGEDESTFTKVHDNDFIRAKKRLYMTATPRLFSDDVKSRAAEADAILCSMDDPALYGEEIYRIGFGEAVERDLLTDYKVLILTLDENDIPTAIQKMISSQDHEINTDDASKLIGCINALSKQVLGDEGVIEATDPDPMQRAVAFTSSIAVSKKVTDTYNNVASVYIDSLPQEQQQKTVPVAAKHVDGTMAAPLRDELLGWLKNDGENGECRILTNVRCLSEGVDVPSLDAVMFLSARNSQVDVVQSVGRVMRKAPGKKYGYIVIPVVVPTTIEADKALDENERYKVVWTVLNALRAHDDRFNATINKIELNQRRPDNILVGRPAYTRNGDGMIAADGEGASNAADAAQQAAARQLALQFQELQGVVFARMVKKVGDRRYWEQWAKSVGEIAERQMERINRLIREDGEHRAAFNAFLAGLRTNINPSVAEEEAVEMLAQHIITRPVFDALFEGYSFVENNSVSVSMQKMLDLLETQAIEKDTAALEKFYESVRMRASGIDNAEGKQRIIIELYDKFFKTAFPRMVERLGIVYTPVELVDFMLRSVDDVLRQEFGRGLTAENVHILDPFTGTGTFITRLLQGGYIGEGDLRRKYDEEIHANEIVLLAYYIAAVNIENAFHDLVGTLADEASEYKSFEGIVLTDTFQLGEEDADQTLLAGSEMFPHNSARVQRQKEAPLRVILGNPPYSIGQKSANDNAQNQVYQKLNSRIEETYAQESQAALSRSLYDAYIKAFRWASDRLDQEQGGIICFVSNGAWLDGNSQDGFRKCLEREFSSIYVFNLRGNQRTSGELSRREGGKIFGSGSRTPIAITLLVKNPAYAANKAKIHYHDIGDYLTREEKLKIVQDSISVSKMQWQTVEPNGYGDWLGQRNDVFDTYIALAPEKKFDSKTKSFFTTYGIGLSTNRDAWTYNFSSESLADNMIRMIAFYNQQQQGFSEVLAAQRELSIDDYVDTDPALISWSVNLKSAAARGEIHEFAPKLIRPSAYRPYCKQRLYFDGSYIERPGLSAKFFPTPTFQNMTINVTGRGASKAFTALISNSISNLDMLEKSQCFPLYYYEEQEKENPTLFDEEGEIEYIRRDGISDFIFARAKQQYGSRVTKEDIFYYVYGFLHSPEYREAFAVDLKKSLPRIPLVEKPADFWAFSKAGRALANFHIHYEDVPPHPDVVVIGAESGHFRVEKMRFPRNGVKDTIHVNSHITVSNIPEAAYEYVVNGRSAIEWVMERYRVTTHKASGITNDPNDWADEVGNPRYILDLLLSVIHVSTQTVAIVQGLPKVSFG